MGVLHTAEAAGPPRDPLLDQLVAALEAEGHEAGLIAAEASVPGLTRSLEAAAPELVFNVAESFDGRSALESNIAALLNLLGLRYTGSSPAGLILAGDKSLAKKIMGFHGILSPRFATLYRGTLESIDELAFPLMVKPPQEDASLGITDRSVVHTVEELLRVTSQIQSEFRQPVLVEEFVPGREFYVGVLGNAHPEALPPVELHFEAGDGSQIASFDAKWAEFEGRLPPVRSTSRIAEDLGAELDTRLRAVAVECFNALRLRDYARIDMRVTAAGEVYVLEANPNCYLEKDSEFALAADRHGLTHARLIGSIVELAAARYAR